MTSRRFAAFAALAMATPIFTGCTTGMSAADGSADGGADSAVNPGVDAAADRGAGEMGDTAGAVGTFQVRVVPPVPAMGMMAASPGYTSVVGKITDGTTPALVILVQAAIDGACRLLTPKVPFCNPPCTGGAACVDDNKCQAYPSAKNVGTVQVTGIQTETGATFTMEEVAKNYQPAANVKLKYPPFTEGADLTFTTGGGAFAAFTVKARGIASLALSNDALKLAANQALTLKWTPPTQSGFSRIRVKLDISHHGGSKGEISCDAEDNGSLTLSAPLLTQLLNLGVAGFPTIIVTRRVVGSTTIAHGRVDLVVYSDVERAVEIPGVVSCTDDSECPMGQKCQNDLRCK